jgi:hypothetical protein
MRVLNCSNDWSVHTPHTNVLWVHYLIDKMLDRKRYEKKAKINNVKLRTLRHLKDAVLGFDSCYEIIGDHVCKNLLIDLGFDPDEFSSSESGSD